MKKIIALFVLALSSLSAIAQSSISGQAVDEANIALPGAVVTLDGSRSTTTDLNGRFSFTGVSADKHVVKLVYASYVSVEAAVNTSNGNQFVVLKTKPGTTELGEIQVVGSLLQGQAKALNRQKSNINSSNVVSSDQVGRFPDDNIGDAAKRIPGITMQNDQGEARNIIIRGMAPQLNSVTINGERIPSAEGDNRNIQMDLIAADMIQTIEVSKALTPDMDADAIGGSVNLVTRAAPAGQRIVVTGGALYNSLSQKVTPNGSFTYGNRFAKEKLGLVFSASSKDHVFGSDNAEFEWNFDDAANPYIFNYEVRQYDVRRLRQNLSANLDFRLAPGHTIFVQSMYSNRKDWENRFRMRFKDVERQEDGTYIGELRMQTKGGSNEVNNARLENQTMYNLALRGEHLFGKLRTDWSVSRSFANELRPNERYIQFRKKNAEVVFADMDPTRPYMLPASVGLALSDYGLHELTQQQQDTDDQDNNARLDFTLPVGKGNLKFGVRYRGKVKFRDVTFNEYEFIDGDQEPSFDDLSIKYEAARADNYMAGDYWNFAAGKSFISKDYLGDLDLDNSALFESALVPAEFAATNYDANENILGAYAMYSGTSGKLDYTAGIRVENTSNVYNGFAFDLDEETSEATSGEGNYTNVLPSVLLKYNLSSRSLIRGSVTSTMARPNYYDLVPYISFSRDDLEAEFGNPDLKAATATNVDLSYENYLPNVGLISAGVFYKLINNFIYTESINDFEYKGTTYDAQTPKNGEVATVQGLELAFQRTLGKSGFAKNLNLYTNATFTASQTTGVRDGENIALAGTAPIMLNASLAYDAKKFTARVSFNHAQGYVDEYGGDAYTDSFYGDQSFVDINAYYALTPKLRVFIDLNNLTNQPLRYYQFEEQYTMQMEYYGFRAKLGVKLDL
jgi:TonB-dependent receptor